MSLPQRRFYSLNELAEAWATDAGMLIDISVEQQLTICARLFCTHVERREGEFPGSKSSYAVDTDVLTGVFPLLPQDLWKIRCHNIARVRCFGLRDEGSGWWQIVTDEPDVEITPVALLVTAEERNRFELEHNLSAHQDGLPFTHSLDYRTVTLNGRSFKLSATRARIVNILHEAWQSGSAWIERGVLLDEAGSGSSRMADVFTDNEERNLLLVSDNRGKWRINLPLPFDRAVAFRRAFRKPHLVLVK